MIDDPLRERDRIMRDMRAAELGRDYDRAAALLRELVPVTRRIRDIQEALA